MPEKKNGKEYFQLLSLHKWARLKSDNTFVFTTT